MEPFEISEEDYQAIRVIGSKGLVNEVVRLTQESCDIHNRYKALGELVRSQYGAANPDDLSKCGKVKLLSLREHWASVIALGLSEAKREALLYTVGECKDDKEKQAEKTLICVCLSRQAPLS